MINVRLNDTIRTGCGCSLSRWSPKGRRGWSRRRGGRSARTERQRCAGATERSGRCGSTEP